MCVYQIANSYQTTERKLKRLNVSIEREQENIRVLSAEWAYLTNPVRLEKLARDYLQLTAMDGRQLVAVASLPMRSALEETYPQADESHSLASNKHVPAAMPEFKMLPTHISSVQGGATHE